MVRRRVSIARDTASIDAAVDLLVRYDPDHHDPRDYVLTIAQTILQKRLQRYDERTWTDEGVQVVSVRG